MKQYTEVKKQYPDAIVLFRLGDFYEMFGEDAEKASRILQIALTSRDRSKDNPTPMCGVPYFAAESYITKLIKAGLKVAVCEQVEDPKEAKGIVAREVVRVITPGTHTPENPKEHSYLMGIFPAGRKHGIAVADISTGELIVFETAENIEDETGRFEPKEIVLPSGLRDNIHYQETLSGRYLTYLDDWAFDYTDAYAMLTGFFRVASLDGYGCGGLTAGISAAGALLGYISTSLKEPLSFKKISTIRQASHMFLDAATQRNLELTHNSRDGSAEGTLLWAVDETLTPMGGRLIRSSILRPMTDMDRIQERLDAVEYLTEDFELLEAVRTGLRKVQDIERLASRISSGKANARDLIAIRISLEELPKIKKSLASCRQQHLKAVAGEMSECSLLKDLIARAIAENPPLSLRDGGIIKDRFSSDIDELRSISTTGKDFIAGIEAREKQRTGISSLKVGFNKVFGYYIEITKANLDMVPADYTRKQTLVGGERFITPELKEYEAKVLGSEDRLKELEFRVFNEILASAQQEADHLLRTSEAVAKADLLASLAVIAKRHNYIKPELTTDSVIEINEGRHPVLERLSSEKFIPNSTYTDTKDDLLLILTGPNMAGKSTYMRQVALITLLAQAGSFVPAASARIGIADRIFTRIGASDFLAKGQSTFMVEMIEAANIIHNATGRSLIILDEVGRGTSTFDGISIAWAIAEHILNRIQARTLFATHYNELTELAILNEGVRNYNISVREWGDEVIFLRKMEEGPADKSYGIQVARLAGIPDSIIARAKEVLHNLEKEELNESGAPKFAQQKGGKKKREQLDLFSSSTFSLVEAVLALDTESMKPEEALERLREFKKKVQL